jgi:cell division GTPase FtsZ
MLFKEVHTFYTELIAELDKEGKAALEVARADLGHLADAIKSSVTAEEQALLKQYEADQPAVQAAIQVAIQSLEQAIASAFKLYGL